MEELFLELLRDLRELADALVNVLEAEISFMMPRLSDAALEVRSFSVLTEDVTATVSCKGISANGNLEPGCKLSSHWPGMVTSILGLSSSS